MFYDSSSSPDDQLHSEAKKSLIDLFLILTAAANNFNVEKFNIHARFIDTPVCYHRVLHVKLRKSIPPNFILKIFVKWKNVFPDFCWKSAFCHRKILFPANLTIEFQCI